MVNEYLENKETLVYKLLDHKVSQISFTRLQFKVRVRLDWIDAKDNLLSTSPIPADDML